MVGHLGCDRTCKALKNFEHNWVGMKEELKKYISECTICKKIKWQRPANWEDMVKHHLKSVAPLSKLSIDTLGLLPEDESGMRYIILIADNFSKFVGLYPANSTSMFEFVKAFLSWVFLVCRRLSEAMDGPNSPPIWPKRSRVCKSISTSSSYPTILKQIQWQRGV